MKPLVLRLPWPPAGLRPNTAWRAGPAKTRLIRTYRYEVNILARHQAEGTGWEAPEKVKVRIWGIKSGPGPLPDFDGLIAALKAGFDGLQDAGLIRGDAPAHFTWTFEGIRRGEKSEVVMELVDASDSS